MTLWFRAMMLWLWVMSLWLLAMFRAFWFLACGFTGWAVSVTLLIWLIFISTVSLTEPAGPTCPSDPSTLSALSLRYLSTSALYSSPIFFCSAHLWWCRTRSTRSWYFRVRFSTNSLPPNARFPPSHRLLVFFTIINFYGFVFQIHLASTWPMAPVALCFD